MIEQKFKQVNEAYSVLSDAKRRAAISIQRAWRRKIGGLTQRPSLEAAAGVIQRSYRRHRDRAVYQYYRDLIRLRENTDTAQMLCSINPTEGQLAESATGLHVRFRLGGESFPPHIMYKIYTHRPVTDIGSFCPRNYVQERAVTTRELHNKAPAGGVDVLVLEGGEATTTGGGGAGRLVRADGEQRLAPHHRQRAGNGGPEPDGPVHPVKEGAVPPCAAGAEGGAGTEEAGHPA